MNPQFDKYPDRLVPAIVQDPDSGRVLMLGFMSDEALAATLETGKVTFYSRSKKRLWQKGETSGNFLELVDAIEDCDRDSLLILARPSGPVCHTGAYTCFAGSSTGDELSFLRELEATIDDRRRRAPRGSYISKLFNKGVEKMAQKVGEEAVETVIASLGEDDDAFIEESADMLFHLLVLLQAKNKSFSDVVSMLKKRKT